MPNENGFEWEGDFEVFDKVKAALERQVAKIITHNAEGIVNLAKDRLGADGGHGVATNLLKSSVTWVMQAQGETVVGEFQGKNYSRLSPPPSGVNKGDFALTIGTPLSYGASLEYGTKPHMPPVDDPSKPSDIIRWVHQKGLSADTAITGTYSVKTHRRTGGKATQDKQDLRMAWMIAIGIKRKGTAAFPWLYPAIEYGQKMIAEGLEELKDLNINER